MVKGDGVITYDILEVINEFESYYTNLLGLVVPCACVDRKVIDSGKKISLEDKQQLVRGVSRDEIIVALLEMDGNKARA